MNFRDRNSRRIGRVGSGFNPLIKSLPFVRVDYSPVQAAASAIDGIVFSQGKFRQFACGFGRKQKLDKKRIDTITESLTDELFALSMLHEMLAEGMHDAATMVSMCKNSVNRCRDLTARLSASGAQALLHSAAPIVLSRAS